MLDRLDSMVAAEGLLERVRDGEHSTELRTRVRGTR
jgi:hypothetical protein